MTLPDITRADWRIAMLPNALRERAIRAMPARDAVLMEQRERFTRAWLRPSQREPQQSYRLWCFVAGRGSGKNFSASHWMVDKALRYPGCHIGAVARTKRDARDVVVLGPSGILAVAPPWAFPRYLPTTSSLVFQNGSVIRTFSADEPDQLRGPNLHFCYMDELSTWRNADAYTNADSATRLGRHPQLMATMTPNVASSLYLLVTRGVADPKTGERQLPATTVVVRDSTMSNAANLAPDYVEAMRAIVDTPRGRAEVLGLDIETAADALWDLELLAKCRTPARLHGPAERVVVGFDPSHSPTGSHDEAGIVVALRRSDGVVLVIDDYSLRDTPVRCWLRAFEAAEQWRADEVVFESNSSPTTRSSFVEDVLSLAKQERRPPANLKFIPQRATVSKEQRSAPIAAAYRAGRVLHDSDVDLEELETEMVQWSPSMSKKSPNRIDALALAVGRLLLADRKEPLVLA